MKPLRCLCRAPLRAERRPGEKLGERAGRRATVKGRTIPELTVELVRPLRLPEGLKNCWIADRSILVVPGLPLDPWDLLTTGLALDPCEAVEAYDGRCQIEVNFDEVKEPGLGHCQGCSGQGVRRWPLFLGVTQSLLKLIATGMLPVEMPTLNWSWDKREDTVGQVWRCL